MKILIHIGKCGGSTVSNAVRGFKVMHLVEGITNDPKNNYVIVIRNPVERFISAFNWRYHLVVDLCQQKDKYPGEKQLLTEYKTVNKLAQNIDTFSGYIHHIHEDIYYYLKDFEFRDNVKIITTENLVNDCLELGIHIHKHLKRNKKETFLTQQERENLKKYLFKDYEIIERMRGILSQEKYLVLSK